LKPTDLLQRVPLVHEPFDTVTQQFTEFVATLDVLAKKEGMAAGELGASLRNLDQLDPAVIGARTALKVVQSLQAGQWLQKRNEPITITIVQAFYHEVERMSPRSKDNPYGEDAVRQKLDMFEELHKRFPVLHFRLLAVDDGCDAGSGKAVQQLVDQWMANHASHDTEARVIFLQQAIDEHWPILPSGIKTTRDSVKGGSILLGLGYAAEEWKPTTARHILVDSDADLSVHPAEVLLLVQHMVETGCIVAPASRREPDSVRLIGASRNSRGKLFIDIWQHLLPTLKEAGIVDTNRGFKGIDSRHASQLVQRISERTFAYQIELLLVAAQLGSGMVSPVGVSYLDSEALSTQGSGPVQSYLNQVARIVAMARRHGEDKHVGYDTELAKFIEALQTQGEKGEEEWIRLEASLDVDELKARTASL
jgi:hypothetical protein